MLDLVDEVNRENIEDLSVHRLATRKNAYVKRVMALVAPIVKSWYLRTSVDYLNLREFKENEEELFADFTEFCTEMLDRLSDSRNQSVRNSYPF